MHGDKKGPQARRQGRAKELYQWKWARGMQLTVGLDTIRGIRGTDE